MTGKKTPLAQAVAQLDATRARTNPIRALRDWRVQAAQTFIRPQPQKGKR